MLSCIRTQETCEQRKNSESLTQMEIPFGKTKLQKLNFRVFWAKNLFSFECGK